MEKITDISLAKLCLSQKLFVTDWQLENLYKNIIEGNTLFGIDVLYVNSEVVACCVINLEENSLNVFVKPEKRCKGYGQKVVAQTLAKYQRKAKETYGTCGIEGSERFYQSCGIAFFKDGYFSMTKQEVSLLIMNKITIPEIRIQRIKEYFDNLAD